jgi:hypothetical protein
MDDSLNIHTNPDADDPAFKQRLEGLAQVLDGMPIQDLQQGAMEKIGDQEYIRDPKTGQLRKRKDAPVNWRDRAIKAEKYLVSMVEERKKLQQLILEACVKLREYGFECEAGQLVNCMEFQEIMAFAKGVPHITRPPLETMRLDGRRAVKKMQSHPEEDKYYLYAECGHVLEWTTAQVKVAEVKMNSLVECQLCTAMLKEKGILEDGS